ncbi:unnamed protein product [Enterobius vermicularis]|uniref:PAP-associated domain-containing protein n=1 Tax=Enterobius vermicularis TaxID=51028 RepID=A0A158Q9H9_ENTVE|nr:unnamed protein product [Enterobius vermicularis]
MSTFDLGGRPYRSSGSGAQVMPFEHARFPVFELFYMVLIRVFFGKTGEALKRKRSLAKLINKTSFKADGHLSQFIQKSSQNYVPSVDSDSSYAIEVKKDASPMKYVAEKQRLSEITRGKGGVAGTRSCSSISFGESRKYGDRNILFYEQDGSGYEFHGHDIRRTIKGLAKRDKQKRMLKKKSRTCIDKDELSCKEESESLKNITVNENFLLRTVPKYNSQDTNDSFKNNISAHIDEKIGGENCAFEKIDPNCDIHIALLTENSTRRRQYDLLAPQQVDDSVDGSDCGDALECRQHGSLDDFEYEKQNVTHGSAESSEFLNSGSAASVTFKVTDSQSVIEDGSEVCVTSNEANKSTELESEKGNDRTAVSIANDDEVSGNECTEATVSSSDKPSASLADSYEQDCLSEKIWEFHRKSLQTELMLARKLHLRDALYYSIATIFPMCGLYVVGSSLNGFGSNSSDMDLCLMITDKELDQKVEAATILQNVKDSLRTACYIRELQLIPAKIPILRMKFEVPYDDIVVDLNANNSVSIRNTHLLSYYSAYDWRVRPLVSVVKEWAKRRDINDANRSSFTSYSLVLMVIHYLQCGAKPAVLPSLQVAYPKRFGADLDVRTLNSSTPLEGVPGIPHNASPMLSLGNLLIGFFHYYAFEFDYVNDAISVRLGRKIERQFVASRQTTYTLSMAQWNCICIEEPFSRTNTAHSMHNEMLFDSIRKAFEEDYEKLSETRDLDAFLDVKPIAPLPFILASNSRSSSKPEPLPTTKKNLLKGGPVTNSRMKLRDSESISFENDSVNDEKDDISPQNTNGNAVVPLQYSQRPESVFRLIGELGLLLHCTCEKKVRMGDCVLQSYKAH